MAELLAVFIEFLRKKLCGKTEFVARGTVNCGDMSGVNLWCEKCGGNFIWPQLPLYPKEPTHCPHCGRRHK